MATPNLSLVPALTTTYNVGMADTFSWVPIDGAGRPLFARATYLANASDISVSLSAGDLNVNLTDVENLITSANTKLDSVTGLLSSQLAQAGFVAIQGGESASGQFSTVQVISACKISSIAATNSTVGPLTALELPTGLTFNGPITNIALSYGAVIVYKL